MCIHTYQPDDPTPALGIELRGLNPGSRSQGGGPETWAGSPDSLCLPFPVGKMGVTMVVPTSRGCYEN